MSTVFNTPILLLIFNRPDTALEVFAEIRKVRPAKLFIAADGPRPNRPEETAKCMEARKVVELVDWPCEVVTLFRDSNMGCKRAVSSAITWFFEQVEEGIILEDDCLPSASFFHYCATLLERYRFDGRVMHICGDGQDSGIVYGDGSYYFSPFSLIWGWASWRRAWKHYDVEMNAYPKFKALGTISHVFPEPTYQKFWLERFDEVYENRLDTWDYQWAFAVMCNHGLAALPNTNMITNIGFREDATHTTIDSKLSSKKRGEIAVLAHPTFMVPDRKAISWTMLHYFFTQEKEHPLAKYKAYTISRSIYGSLRRALGLN